MVRGNLILIEGLDRTGKSTQSELLAQRLDGALIRFPDRMTPIGELIDKYLRDPTFDLPDEAIHLLFSANRWELVSHLKSCIQDRVNVVLDRYVYSGIAYSMGKENPKSQEWLYNPDKGLPKPDLTIFLTMSMEELCQRKNWGAERYEQAEIQEKVKKSFMSILKPEEDPSVAIVNVNKLSIEEVTAKLWDIIQERNLHRLSNSELQVFE